MGHPLHVAILWHMHQPYYRDTVTGEYMLPWVRLHAVKDYLHMAEVVAEFPEVHVTFNYVPSLVEQIEDEAAGRATGIWTDLCRRDRFSTEDRQFLATHFFSINWDKFVRIHPRYWRMLQLRNQLEGDIDLLSDQYWRDLVVWFNLVWVDPEIRRRDTALAALVDKGAGFSREDADVVLARHRELCGRVVPALRALQGRGQIEITTTPYYHPILPLLVETRVGRDPSPHLRLPQLRFTHPEDAQEQLAMARTKHTATFGTPPNGLWPSEGAVSHDVAGIVAAGGWRWLASDEAILARSIGRPIERDGVGQLRDPRDLCQPYLIGETDLAIFCRDRDLSDRIGFVYSHMTAADAAADFLDRLRQIHTRVRDDPDPYVVPIILDGENCWEGYANNGSDFLRLLYSGLRDDPSLRTVTFSDYLNRHPPRRRIERLATGSWIFGNLETWIGESQQNRAWEYLAMARSRLATWQAANLEAPPAIGEAAWRELQIAEGSDWFWWYYSRNRFGQEHLFDVEYRRHLANVYRIIGEAVPSWLALPIVPESDERSRPPTRLVTSRVDDDLPDDDEWSGAGFVEPLRSTGAMQQGAGAIRRLYYGYDRENLWLRLDGQEDLSDHTVHFFVAIPGPGGNQRPRLPLPAPPHGVPHADEERTLPYQWEIVLPPIGQGDHSTRRAQGGDRWREAEHFGRVARRGAIIEMGLPLSSLAVGTGDTVGVVVVLARDGVTREALPTGGQMSFQLLDLG